MQRLRRPPARTARARSPRTSCRAAAPGDTHSTGGMAELRGLAARRVAHPRGHLLEVDRARVAVGRAHHGQRPRREPGALRALPAQAEQLQRDGERVQAGRRHVRPAGLHRRPVRRPRQGLPANRQEPHGGAQGDQRRQAGHGARRRGLRGPQLRADPRHRRNCTTTQIDAELDQLESVGVQSLFPVHKFDNALGGTKFDSGTTGVLVNAGNKYATGKFWNRRALRRRPTTTTSPRTRPASTPRCSPRSSGRCSRNRCSRDSCRSIRRAPLCNPRGLTPLGEHLIRSMMRRGMIIETDHLSVKARQEALTILEADNYPGVISSHSWGDAGSQKRIQQPRRPDRADHARGQRLRGRLA